MPDYEVIVVGSGVGGGTAATALADAGRRVLVVERGVPLTDASAFQDEQRMLVDRVASDDRPLTISGHRARALIGGVPGGGSALYGAALLRPSPEDFVPGRHYGDRIPRAIWEWPFQYEDLEAHYARAEDLFRVSGDAEQETPHLGRRATPFVQKTPSLDPFNARLAEGLARSGATPFALPLAIDFETCLRCPTCPGYVCPTGARTSTARTLLEPRADSGDLDLWTGVEAMALEHAGGRVRGIRLRERRTGRVSVLTADHYLLASGALGSPLLLEDSGLGEQSDELGRNHMCHLGAIAVSVFARPIGADRTFLKRLGLSDDYLGLSDGSGKLGSAQAVPIPGLASMREQLGFPLPSVLARAIHRRTILMAGYVEDLPRRENRVRRATDGGIELHRSFSAFDVARGRIFARRLARLMRAAGATFALPVVSSRDREHLAHQVGTCRAGTDPRSSVVDGLGRLHGHDDVWVVDGSVLPTSLGVGPALTIAAHALRVSESILGRVSR